MDQDIRFCRTSRGVSIAYASNGDGPPLVKAANWLNHLEFDWQSPIWSHWLHELGRTHRLVRYDERGNGLSDWEVADLGFDSWVRDLEAVVDHLGLETFDLLGISQGGPVAIAYAVRHPERVRNLVLYGAYARGWNRRPERPTATEDRRALLTLTRHGWGRDNPAFRQVWTSQFVPGGSMEQMRWFNELQRKSTSPENAVRFLEEFGEIEVTELLGRVRTPTLVLHCREDAAVPFDEGRRLARGIPDARFVPLEGDNHLLLETDAAWVPFLREVRSFLGVEADPAELRTLGRRVVASGFGAAEVGDRLGRYRLEGRLGEGGMGVVFRAWDERLGRSVALKILHPHSGPDPAAQQSALLQEARAAAGLSHPAICTVFDADEIDGVACLAMEWVEGRTLEIVLAEDGPLPAVEVRELVRGVLKALEHAHEHGIVHRDLKAGNVMQTARGPKVLDFGLAKVEGDHDLAGEAGRDTFTGTVPYMAPEQLRGEPADARSDLWAVGVLAQELLTGRRPFTGRTPYALVTAIMNEAPAPLPDDTPDDLRAVVEACLVRDRSGREASAGALCAELRPAPR